MTNALLGRPQEDPEYLYWEFHEGVFSQAVRFGDWKAVRTDFDQTIEIYNLSYDRGEERDLAGEHPEIVEKADELFRTARTSTEHWPTKLDN